MWLDGVEIDDGRVVFVPAADFPLWHISPFPVLPLMCEKGSRRNAVVLKSAFEISRGRIWSA